MAVARTSLLRQLGQRVLVAVLLIALMAAAADWLVWRYQAHAETQQWAEQQRSTLRARLDFRLQDWQSDVEALAASITYQRMLEPPGALRWQKLHAYVTSLAETYPYSGLVVVNGQGRVVFSAGQEADDFPLGALVQQHADWYHSHDHHQLHRVQRAPLWQGLDGGRGELWLLRPLDNQALQRFALPGVNVHVTVDDVVYASSLGNATIGRKMALSDAVLHRSDADRLCADLPLPGGIAKLHIERNQPPLQPAGQFALAGLALLLALLLALYLALGGWARRTLSRVRALDQAAAAFDAHHQIDASVESALGQSGSKFSDEIHSLQATMRMLMQSTEARTNESRAYMQTLDMLEEAVVEVDRDGQVLRASAALERLLGQNAQYNLLLAFHPDDQQVLAQSLEQLFVSSKDMVSLRLRSRDHDGLDGGWIECRFVAAGQPVTRIRGVLRDITQAYLHEKQVTHMALHDALTGLPNRILLEDRCKVALRLAQREPGHVVGIGFIDIDHFKHINDNYGHKVGDQLLKAFALRLRQSLRESDTLARWGGDEFVVLLPAFHALGSAQEFAAKMAALCPGILQADGVDHSITFSMGFALYPNDSDNVDTLLAQADRAMFHAKAQGRNNVQFFSSIGDKGPGKKDLYIQSRLAAAIHDQRIQTFFQPVVETVSRRIVGFEALARWHDAQHGWVSPASFIPMAENLGLVRELGDQVWEAALCQLARHQARGLRMSVNLSSRQLFMPYFTEKLLADVARHGLKPADIVLEVTESVALQDVDHSAERLKALAHGGFCIAVDDFGTGYSSLSQLHAMPVTELKIDMAFVQRIHEPSGKRMVQAIVQIAAALDLQCVAEGVEDESVAAVLQEMGVHLLQGYLFARPMSADDMDALLASGSEIP